MASASVWEGFDVTMKFLGRGMATAFVVWLYFNGLSLRYNFTRPTEAQLENGRIYPLFTHGRIVYLTHAERIHLLIPEVVSIGLGLICLAIFLYRRRMLKDKKSYLFRY